MTERCQVCGKTLAQALNCSCAQVTLGDHTYAPVQPYDPEDYPDMREVDWQDMFNPNEGDK